MINNIIQVLYTLFLLYIALVLIILLGVAMGQIGVNDNSLIVQLVRDSLTMIIK